MRCKKHHIQFCKICNISESYIADDGYPNDGQGTKDFFDDEQERLKKELDEKIAKGEVKIVTMKFSDWKKQNKGINNINEVFPIKNKSKLFYWFLLFLAIFLIVKVI